MAKQVVVLDYGSGNVHSAINALQRQGADVTLSADPKLVAEAEGLVVPGVGAFASVMKALQTVAGPRLIDRRLAGGRPVLGICVGMQIMFEQGDEHGQVVSGLAQWPGQVTALKAPIIPHMGWSTVEAAPGSQLFHGLTEERFYFVHSYAVKTDLGTRFQTGSKLPKPLVSWAEHGEKFVAAVENGPLSATQFHPEKSGEAGALLLRNWLDTL